MIIILEGIDKSGKTSVIQDLEKDVLVNSIVWKVHNKPKTGNRRDQDKIWTAYSELFHQALATHKKINVVFDRSYPSELVYSQVKRRYDAFYDLRWWELDKSLKDDVVLIYCYAPEEELKKRFFLTGEKHLTESEFPKILGRYDWFLQRTKLPTLKLDTTKSRSENIAEMQKFINEYQRHKNQLQ